MARKHTNVPKLNEKSYTKIMYTNVFIILNSLFNTHKFDFIAKKVLKNIFK